LAADWYSGREECMDSEAWHKFQRQWYYVYGHSAGDSSPLQKAGESNSPEVYRAAFIAFQPQKV